MPRREFDKRLRRAAQRHSNSAPAPETSAAQRQSAPRPICPARQPRDLREARDVRRAVGGRERAAAINQPLAVVRLELPFRQHHRRGHDGRGEAHAFSASADVRGQFQIQSSAPRPGRACCGSGIRSDLPSITGTTAAPLTVADHNSRSLRQRQRGNSDCPGSSRNNARR